MDEKEFLMKVMEENWIHARQSEDKRALIANLILILTAIIQITITLTGFILKAIPVTLLLIFIGGYGILTTMKLYERAQFHTLRARALRSRLNELFPNAQVQDLQINAERKHQEHYPIFYKTRLNNIWLCTYVFIIVLGIVETMICIWM